MTEAAESYGARVQHNISAVCRFQHDKPGSLFSTVWGNTVSTTTDPDLIQDS